MTVLAALLRLLPWSLVVVSQLLALVAMRGELASRGLRASHVWPSLVGYLLAAVLGVPSLVGAVRGWPSALALAIVAALCVSGAPLLWGRAIGEFHLSHHLIRLAIVVVALVLYWWHVALHR